MLCGAGAGGDLTPPSGTSVMVTVRGGIDICSAMACATEGAGVVQSGRRRGCVMHRSQRAERLSRPEYATNDHRPGGFSDEEREGHTWAITFCSARRTLERPEMRSTAEVAAPAAAKAMSALEASRICRAQDQPGVSPHFALLAMQRANTSAYAPPRPCPRSQRRRRHRCHCPWQEGHRV